MIGGLQNNISFLNIILDNYLKVKYYKDAKRNRTPGAGATRLSLKAKEEEATKAAQAARKEKKHVELLQNILRRRKLRV